MLDGLDFDRDVGNFSDEVYETWAEIQGRLKAFVDQHGE